MRFVAPKLLLLTIVPVLFAAQSFNVVAQAESSPGAASSQSPVADDPTARYREMRKWWVDEDGDEGESAEEQRAQQVAYDAFQRFMLEAANKERQRYAPLMPSVDVDSRSYDSSGGRAVLGGGSSNFWVNIGPSKADFIRNGVTLSNITDAGRAVDIVIHPANNNIIYLAVSGGGVWRSVNAGLNWIPLTETLGSLSVGGLAIDPSNPQVLYLGFGDPFDGTGVGLVKSVDGGNTWGAPVFLGTSTRIREVTVSPTATNVILVATNQGLFRSDNSGGSFSLVTINTGLLAIPEAWEVEWAGGSNFLMSFIADPSIAGVAATGQIWRSTNQGLTWVISTGVTKAVGVRRISVASAPSNRNIAYAKAADGGNSQLADLFVSNDNGITWTAMGADSTSVNYTNTNGESPGPRSVLNGQGFYNHMLLVHPTDANQFFFGGALHVARATFNGATWQYTQMSNWLAQFGLPYVHADMHAAVFDSSGKLYVGSDGGLFRSNDMGLTWTDDLNEGVITHLFYSVGSSPNNADAVVGGLQDNGTRVRVGATGTYNQIIGGDGFGSHIHQLNASNMIGTLYNTRLFRSTNGGSTFSSASSGITESNTNNAPFNTKVHPWEGDVSGNTLITHVNLKVYTTSNYASSWTALGTAGLPTSGWVIRNIGIAQSNQNHVGIVGSGGSVWLTTDGGTTWTAPTTLPNNGSYTSWIAYDRVDPTIIYVASVAPDETRTHLWKTTNGGTNWTAIDTGGLPTGVPVNSIKTHPTTPTTLFAGTHLGVYRSTNGGTNWTRYGSNLPLTNVTDTYISPDADLLRVATFGRGIWELAPTAINLDPTANFTYAAVGTGEVINFTDTSTDPENSIVFRIWDFGNGNTSNATNPSFTFPGTGTYPVQLTVIDHGGAANSTTIQVAVTSVTIFNNGFEAPN